VKAEKKAPTLGEQKSTHMGELLRSYAGGEKAPTYILPVWVGGGVCGLSLVSVGGVLT